MSSRQIAPDVYWVGVKNPDLRVFDVIMETQWGTTYNAYLIKGTKKTALVEMVKDRFAGECLQNISKIIDPKEIDYIIVDHTEPDHTGAVTELLQVAVNAKVIGSRSALMFLAEIANRPFESQAVKTGDEIDLGGKTLQFISAPFLHWPDSMFTYVKEDQVLISGDVFGCHYAPKANEIFLSEIDENVFPAQKYYYDVIMSPFKEYMLDAIRSTEQLEIKWVCPSHGPILNRGEGQRVIELNREWSKDILEKKAVKKIFIGYVTCYGYTRQMGEAIAAGIKKVGQFDVEMMDVSEVPLAEAVAAIESADGILLGSPTVNRDVLPPVWSVLASISAIKNKCKLCGAFGSYGWSGEAVGMIKARLESLQLRFVGEGARAKLKPNSKELDAATDYGEAFAIELNAK